MARICTAICASHSPFLYANADEWEPARAARASHGGIALHTPIDSSEENQRKHARCSAALNELRMHLRASRPDVLLIFGDDQAEQFGFDNCPALAVFAGDAFSGFKVSPRHGLPVPRALRAHRQRSPEHWTNVRGAPVFARLLIVELMRRDFDIAFCLSLPRVEQGIGHAFMRPLYSLTPEFDIPTVPFFVNCYFGPQPTGRRCVQLGMAVRDVIDAMPGDTRVALIGSGGLWHMPMFPDADLDEQFDRAMLAALEEGDALKMSELFDTRTHPVRYDDAASTRQFSGGTGMLLGLGGGSGEIRNWIITSAAMAGRRGTIVDYVPVYASPIGMGFAYWKED